MKITLSFLFFLLFVLTSCDQPAPPLENTPDLPGRRDLIRSARRGANWLWVYAASDSLQAKAYQALLEPVVLNPPFEQKISLRAANEVSAEDLARHPIFLLGSEFPEDWYSKISTPASLQVAKKQFSFADESFSGAKDVFQVFYHPNPWNTSWPMHMMLANDDTYLIEYLTKMYQDDWAQLYWSSWGYAVFQAEFTRFLGYFGDSTWALDRKVHFSFSTEADTLLQGPEANWIGHDVELEDAYVRQLHAQFLTQRDSLQQFLEIEQISPLSFHLYPSVEHKGLERQNMEPAEGIPDRQEIHLVSNRFFQGDQAGEDMRVLLRKHLGKPKVEALENGLAMRFTPSWGKKGANYWAARLYQAQHLFSMKDLLDNELMEAASPLLLAPSAAALTDFLLHRYGKTRFLQEYKEWEPSPDSIAQLQKAWEVYLHAEYAKVEEGSRKDPATNFLRGYTFAHEGYRVYNGFGSQAARSSLEELQTLGTDAVSIVPYSYMSNPQQANPIPIVRRAGTENDPATVFAHFSAKELGMYSLLKPQIWVRGSWPGDIDFSSEKEWEDFFLYYDRWMTHYVMMAEMYDFDAIAVGTELAKTTIKYPEQWRGMLKRWRKLYRGTITYAANWGEEIEQLSFWDELDYVGCNCYYPLADSTESDIASLTAGANVMLDKISLIAKKVQKPIWLTEIGYRSVSAPWRNPHAEANGRPYNGEHQAMAYEALFQALNQHSDVKGIFWWKWPSYLSYAGRNKTGFTPLGKPAEKVITKWFN